MQFVPGDLYIIKERVRFFSYPGLEYSHDGTTPQVNEILLFLKFVKNEWKFSDQPMLKIFLYDNNLLLDSFATAHWPSVYLDHIMI